MDYLRLVNSLPTVKRIYDAVNQAKSGDPAALTYLKKQGWVDIAEIVKPGVGEVARQSFKNVTDFVKGDYIDAEWRVVDTYPWSGFLKRLLTCPAAGHIMLGPIGSGKTSLALRLAQRYQESLGYDVETTNLYLDDRPTFGTSIGMDTLVDRMAQLSRYLASFDKADVDSTEQPAGPPVDDEWNSTEGVTPSLPPTNKVIVIDEAGMAMSANYADPKRRASIQALAQCRHLSWQVLYIGQMAGQLSLPLLGQSIIWIKQPNGRESRTDRQHPVVQDLWERAMAAFEDLPHSEFYVPPYNDPRAWAFCECQSLLGKPGYTGMVPFAQATQD